MDNNKKFGLSSFILFFAKTMIEVFIPIILYNRGFNITEILIYMMFQYFLAIIITYIIPKIDNIVPVIIAVVAAFSVPILDFIFTFSISNLFNSFNICFQSFANICFAFLYFLNIFVSNILFNVFNLILI